MTGSSVTTREPFRRRKCQRNGSSLSRSEDFSHILPAVSLPSVLCPLNCVPDFLSSSFPLSSIHRCSHNTTRPDCAAQSLCPESRTGLYRYLAATIHRSCCALRACRITTTAIPVSDHIPIGRSYVKTVPAAPDCRSTSTDPCADAENRRHRHAPKRRPPD